MDFQLLPALDALLTEVSVTRAARRLGLSQPATSHALARLREMFGDPLLVRSGRQMVLSPRGEALREPLKRLLAEAERLVHHGAGFDPATTERVFSLLAPDLIAPLLGAVIGGLRREAPHARLEVVGQVRDERQALESGETDLVVGAGVLDHAGLMTRTIFQVHWGVVAREGHPVWDNDAGVLSVNDWLSYPHAMVRRGHGGQSFVAKALLREGLERQIGFVAPSFLATLMAVAETDCFFAVPMELVAPMLVRFQLRAAPLPLGLPAVPVVALWHERYQADPAHRFFRELVVGALQRGTRGNAEAGVGL